MTFKVGDRVTAKREKGYRFGVGTIVSVGGRPLNNSDTWYYINWDEHKTGTYALAIKNTMYPNIYGLYERALELVQSTNIVPDPALPADPRLRGIAIKIRDMEYRFKNRHNTYAYNNKERVLSDFQRSKVCSG